MARHYSDTSALIKQYLDEAGTPEVQRLLALPGVERFLSRLGTVEIISGFASKVRTADLTAAGFATVQGRFAADLKRRTIRPVRIVNAHYQLAGKLVTRYGLGRQFSALDAVQLAVALRLHMARPLDLFVCADRRLCEVAALEGLAVLNPDPRP